MGQGEGHIRQNLSTHFLMFNSIRKQLSSGRAGFGGERTPVPQAIQPSQDSWARIIYKNTSLIPAQCLKPSFAGCTSYYCCLGMWTPSCKLHDKMSKQGYCCLFSPTWNSACWCSPPHAHAFMLPFTHSSLVWLPCTVSGGNWITSSITPESHLEILCRLQAFPHGAVSHPTGTVMKAFSVKDGTRQAGVGCVGFSTDAAIQNVEVRRALQPHSPSLLAVWDEGAALGPRWNCLSLSIPICWRIEGVLFVVCCCCFLPSPYLAGYIFLEYVVVHWLTIR